MGARSQTEARAHVLFECFCGEQDEGYLDEHIAVSMATFAARCSLDIEAWMSAVNWIAIDEDLVDEDTSVPLACAALEAWADAADFPAAFSYADHAAMAKCLGSFDVDAQEALAGLKKMNKQFVDGCYLFEELGGPAGKNGNYNPEEIEEYKVHLNALDADATERSTEWVKYAEGVLERHNERAKEEIDKFYEAMKNVATDISLLEAVDKEVRTCSLMQQQLLSSHDALVETLDSKIVELEALCAEEALGVKSK